MPISISQSIPPPSIPSWYPYVCSLCLWGGILESPFAFILPYPITKCYQYSFKNISHLH